MLTRVWIICVAGSGATVCRQRSGIGPVPAYAVLITLHVWLGSSP